MCSRLIAATAAMAILSGCTTVPAPQAGSLDSGFGEVSKWNAAVQIIDPQPVYPADAAQPGDHGEKAANATKRYRTDQARERHKEEARPTRNNAAGGGSGPR